MRDKDECLKSLVIATCTDGGVANINSLSGYWPEGEVDFRRRVNRLVSIGELEKTGSKLDCVKLK